MEKRSEFSSKIGFVLAAAGSAVGLGNIWRFPFLAAKYGGGIFLLVYIILVVTFGFTVMIAEIAIGRKTHLSSSGAFKKLNSKWGFVGVIASVISFLILPYYCVIGGWVTKYLFAFLFGQSGQTAQDAYFSGYISTTAEPIFWQMLFMLATAVIVFNGVKNGIEKFSKVLMPLLVILSVGIAIYVATLPGAFEGIKFFFTPRLSAFSVKTVLAALGQMFYSMSLAMGIMITYGSYLPKETDLEKSVKQIELFDTGIAIVSGLMVIPAVFAFSGGDSEVLNSGPQLMFVTLPKVFDAMGAGTAIGVLFFLLVLFAALTSSVSILETSVSNVCDKFKLSRKKSVILVTLLTAVLGIPSSLGFGVWENFKIAGMQILDFMDFFTNSMLMPITAFLTCVFVAYVIGVKAVTDEIKLSSQFKREKLFNITIRYIAPVCIIAILVTSFWGGI